MAKQHTQINPSKHQRSMSYDAYKSAYKSKDSAIRFFQKWRVEREDFLAKTEKGSDLLLLASVPQPASAAFVIEISAESDAPALERHPSFIPVSSPVHSAAVGSMQLQVSSEASVNLGGESLVQNPGEVIFI